MKMLIDTNVLMDVLVGQEPFLQRSRYVVELCKDKIIQGYLAAHTITNLFYMLRKYYPSDECHDILLNVFDIFSVVAVDEEKMKTALRNKSFKDFEDCLQVECGKTAKVDYVVTRDMKDFTNSDIPCLTPDEVYNMFLPDRDERL